MEYRTRHLAAGRLAALTCVGLAVGAVYLAIILADQEPQLLTVFRLQLLLDPAAVSARLLPFWSMRELGTYAVDLADAGYLRCGILHGAGMAAGLTAAFSLLPTVRLRRRSYLRVAPEPEGRTGHRNHRPDHVLLGPGRGRPRCRVISITVPSRAASAEPSTHRLPCCSLAFPLRLWSTRSCWIRRQRSSSPRVPWTQRSDLGHQLSYTASNAKLDA